MRAPHECVRQPLRARSHSSPPAFPTPWLSLRFSGLFCCRRTAHPLPARTNPTIPRPDRILPLPFLAPLAPLPAPLFVPHRHPLGALAFCAGPPLTSSPFGRATGLPFYFIVPWPQALEPGPILFAHACCKNQANQERKAWGRVVAALRAAASVASVAQSAALTSWPRPAAH